LPERKPSHSGEEQPIGSTIETDARPSPLQNQKNPNHEEGEKQTLENV